METKHKLKQLFLKIKIFAVFSSVGKRFFFSYLIKIKKFLYGFYNIDDDKNRLRIKQRKINLRKKSIYLLSIYKIV